ncbi:AI-2E family transporter [candidate division WWE3 bacterium]|uniref:AI-2E family transporter n=1 Tax=candidate division WWE3 bacterium TaxID=2053526 RepID=A0A7X9DL23_UNCKA|nr:AI-2E family transporter [candidate division WWE3 bacterium]
MDKQVVISYKSIVFFFLLVIAGYIVVRLAPVIGLFLISLVIVFAVEPLIKKLMRLVVLNRTLSRGIAVCITYVLVIIFMIFIVTVGLPPFISQIEKLVRNFSVILSGLQLPESFNIKVADLIPQASKISESIITTIFSLFSNITTVITLLIFSLYMSLDLENNKARFYSLFRNTVRQDVKNVVEEIELSMGQWVKGQSFLMLVVGILSFIGLMVLDVEYAPALGLISGILEIVPMIGPILSAVIAAIVAFSDSTIKGIGVLALYVIVQQLENNLLVPKIMQRVSGSSPLVILLALMIGSEFFGIVGAILAVPMVMVSSVILKKVLRYEDYIN